MDRYSRQKLLPEFGESGQVALGMARVLIVGVGGLGSPAALYLAASGIGHLGLVDDDRVDMTNLQRQIIFSEADVGDLKVHAAQKNISRLNSQTQIHSYAERFSVPRALEIARSYDLILDGTDNFASKYLVNDVALKLNKPMVYGAVSGFEGRVATFWKQRGACYRCLHPQPPKQFIANCQQSGILGATVGAVGSLQALEAIKVIMDMNQVGDLKPRYGSLWVMDFIRGSVEQPVISQSRACLCTKDPESIEIREEVRLCDRELNELTLTWAQMKDLKKDYSVLDVRELAEWKQGHLDSAYHWPLSLIEKGDVPPFLKDSANWIIYCAKGYRSLRALHLLRNQVEGINIRSLTGGLDARGAG